MKVGRRHRWRYDQGEWTEKKVTPDEWQFEYAVTKRRAGRAPDGSGAPVGTAYHWYILAHQVVTKLDANSYSTEMAGLKFKLAHRRADKGSWSASERAQRKRLVVLLRDLIDDLERAPEVEAAARPEQVTRPAKKRPARRTPTSKRQQTASTKRSTRRPKRTAAA